MGTSGVKCGVFRDDGTLLGLGRSSIPEFQSPHVGWAQSNPVLWWKGVRLSLSAAFSNAGIRPCEIDAIGLSVFYPAVVPMDSRGSALYPAILYNDQRSGLQVDRILEKVDRREYEERIGNKLVPGTCAVTSIEWLREVKPEVFGKAKIIGFANTYLLHKLTGEFSTDPSNAALSGLTDICNPWEWSDHLCRVFSIDPSTLPTIAGSCDVIGSVGKHCAEETGLQYGTPVVVGCGDAVASSFGAGALQPGTVTYIGGSSDCITMPLAKPLNDHRWINDAYLERESWLGIGTVTSSGAALDWFSREILNISGDKTYDFFSSLPSFSDERAGGPLFLPYLQGERTPIWDPNARGVFFGISSSTTRHELARAVLTGVAFALRDVVECIEETQGITVEEMRAVGGSTKNELWNQIKANVLQKAVQILDFQETGSLGAAVLAGVGVGAYHSLGEANRYVRKFSVARTIEPQRDKRSLYDESFQLYRRLYTKTKDLMSEQSKL